MTTTSRRSVLGAGVAGTGLLLAGGSAAAAATNKQAPIDLRELGRVSKGMTTAATFPLVEAIAGRRSRRFAKGAQIPNGPLAFKSEQAPAPLSEQEQLMLLTAISGNTGWANLIPHSDAYAPDIPNYLARPGGRTFPTAAGFNTSELFFTDDEGTYFFSTRDMEPEVALEPDAELDLGNFLARHKRRIRKLASGRLKTPRSPEHMETHNNWCANVAGSSLFIPVSDLAQHHILNICYLVQNGAGVIDDIRGRPIPGLEGFSDVLLPDAVYPMSLLDQMSLTEVTVETSCGLYAGALMLQALGLGGWMYGGINPMTILGASGDPSAPGLGFRFDTNEDWPMPNATGLPDVFEAHCRPHFPSMRDAVEHVVALKFGEGGPYNASTPGPYKDNARARSAGLRYNKRFVECVTLICDYIDQEYGKFPATIPSMFTMMYLQAHQLDLDFYDQHFEAGKYLRTHRDHDRDWSVS